MESAEEVVSSGRSSLDAYTWTALRGALVYTILFTLLHFGLRRRRIAGRPAYAAIGSAAALACVCSLCGPHTWRYVLHSGRISAIASVALAAGAVMGFLYQWRAGLEAADDDPARLAALLSQQAGPMPDGAPPVDTIQPDRALADTGSTEYFAGPLQVRTSLPVAFIATLVASGAYALVRGLFGMAGDLSYAVKNGSPLPWDETLATAALGQLGPVALTVLLTVAPFTFVVLLAHSLLKSWSKSSQAVYIVAGLMAPLAMLLALGPAGLLLGLQAAVPLALSMSTYRAMAGLEPKPVQEDVRVGDRRHLVGFDHVRRRYGRVVKA